jgi:hypothetical protein
MSLITPPPGETTHRERPIAFAAAMIRALLDGRKTQTRRVILPQPTRGKPPPHVDCRFGAPGERLWVRERWGYSRQFADPRAADGGPIVYAADPDASQLPGPAWRPSRYMPRSASRILLCIQQVRAERLTRITPADARAEGFDPAAEIADPIQWFRALWDELSSDAALRWEANPWVWVIGFEVINVNEK